MALNDFDDILIILGLGKWNMLYHLTFGMYAFTIASFILAFSYVAPSVNFDCDVNEVIESVSDVNQCHYLILKNKTIDGSSHLVEEKCTSWIYNDTYFENTLSSEFDLVCDKAYLRPIYQMMITMGGFVGTPINGYLSDKYGRKRMMVITTLISIFSVLISTFSTDLMSILVLRFFTGLTTFPSIQTGFTLCMEVCEPKLRTIVGMFLGLPWAFGTMWWGALGYMIKDWRWLLRMSTIPGYIYLGLLLIISESPRWLIVSGNHKKALKAINRAGKWNKVVLPQTSELLKRMQAIQKSSRRQSTTENERRIIKSSLTSKVINEVKQIFILFRTPELRRVTILMYITFIVSATVYYGLSFSAINFKLDPFMYMIVGGLMEVPACTIVVPIIVKIGMIPFTSFSFFICGVNVLILSFIPDIKWLTIILAMIAKLFITAAFQAIYLLATEEFPTEVRMQGIGTSAFFSSIGSVMAPFITELLGSYQTWMSSVIFGVASILAGTATVFLPETRNRHLFETVSQLEKAALRRKNKKSSEMNFDEEDVDEVLTVEDKIVITSH